MDLDIVIKTGLGALISALVLLLTERARRHYKLADSRSDQNAERLRRSDKFDSLLSAARRWKRKAARCMEWHAKGSEFNQTLGVSLTELLDEMDLSEWEPPSPTPPQNEETV